MAGMKKKPQERERDASLVLFLALNMILLAFFILLTALSAPNKTKQNKINELIPKAFQSFGGAFLGLGEQLQEQGISRDQNPISDSEKVEAYLGELSRFVEENKEQKAISYEIVSEGILIHVAETASFREGSAELLDRGIPLYNNILNLILRTSNAVRIEGHTDNADIRSSEARDNWDLSARRAMAVFRFLTASGEVPESRFSVVGYGKQRPLVSNLTEAGRARNRRVTVVFVGKLKPFTE